MHQRQWRCRFPERRARAIFSPSLLVVTSSFYHQRRRLRVVPPRRRSGSSSSARSLPAVLAANAANIHGDMMHSIVAVEADAVERFAANTANAVTIASDASIPLASGTVARFVVFRDALGVDQVAIIVGKPRFCRARPGSASFGMSDRRRVWLPAMRLWRPATARAHAPGKPRWRRHSVPCPGRPRHWSCEQDASLSIAGRRARYARRQHDAGLRGR